VPGRVHVGLEAKESCCRLVDGVGAELDLEGSPFVGPDTDDCVDLVALRVPPGVNARIERLRIDPKVADGEGFVVETQCVEVVRELAGATCSRSV
jgi:hypothetical protein